MIRIQKMCQSQQFVTWDPGFCHPGSNFRWKKIKNPAIVENVFFFSLELELGTYINLYLFESSIERPLGIFLLSDSTKISDYAERAELAKPTLCKNLFTNPDFEAI